MYIKFVCVSLILTSTIDCSLLENRCVTRLDVLAATKCGAMIVDAVRVAPTLEQVNCIPDPVKPMPFNELPPVLIKLITHAICHDRYLPLAQIIARRPVDILPHTKRVNGIAWHPHKDALATACADGVVRIWPCNEGEFNQEGLNERRLIELTGHTSGILHLAWRPDGLQLATSSTDGSVGIWTEQPDQSYGGEKLICPTSHNNTVAWNFDGSKLASFTSQAGNALIWHQPLNDQNKSIIDQESQINSIAWHTARNALIAASCNGNIRIWGQENQNDDQKLFNTIRLPDTSYTGCWTRSIAYNPMQEQFASADGQNVKMWLKQDDVYCPHNLSGHSAVVHQIAWNKSGDKLASASADGTIKIWDNNPEKKYPHITLNDNTALIIQESSPSSAPAYAQVVQAPFVYSVAWNKNGSKLAASFGNGAVHVYAMPPCLSLEQLIAVLGVKKAQENYIQGVKKYAQAVFPAPSSEGHILESVGQSIQEQLGELEQKTQSQPNLEMIAVSNQS